MPFVASFYTKQYFVVFRNTTDKTVKRIITDFHYITMRQKDVAEPIQKLQNDYKRYTLLNESMCSLKL